MHFGIYYRPCLLSLSVLPAYRVHQFPAYFLFTGSEKSDNLGGSWVLVPGSFQAPKSGRRFVVRSSSFYMRLICPIIEKFSTVYRQFNAFSSLRPRFNFCGLLRFVYRFNTASFFVFSRASLGLRSRFNYFSRFLRVFRPCFDRVQVKKLCSWLPWFRLRLPG